MTATVKQLPNPVEVDALADNTVRIAETSYRVRARRQYSHNCRGKPPWTSSPLILSQFPRLATVDELASNIITIAVEEASNYRGRATRERALVNMSQLPRQATSAKLA